MKSLGVIPARLESSRLPGKVLLDICGKPMIQHVWEKAICSQLDDVIIATDSNEVVDVAKDFGANVFLTSSNHTSGTSRLVELSQSIKSDLYINIQGDEPLISPQLINDLIQARKLCSSRNIFTAANSACTEEEYLSPNVVKLITDVNMDAIYFSRSPIPYYRNENSKFSPLKHIGIYGYTFDGLQYYKSFGESLLETVESLEQLRFIENGQKIRVITTEYESIGVDTEDDLLRVRYLLDSK
ncbi:3-deoxy-manno-octulosonate cytidylyltransferase [Paenibacillus sp. H1-7]|uniref:3-deoxy-manno-octulosonate cytidylyltransferase n=1 Tax=Paenibacillus sp. H1-7 TaxID=2282849 RepID=UPI001EF8B0E2|nr:3-deoxy-manno-octulosonate cytidylyltransferase [Paenibacillus sp. H1-7]ULL19038.1 3-deoxy-manno-octulosonate cytidylyltransferase [Paenibacillus sp. H1-7]